MAQPTSGDVHLDAALSDMSIAYMQSADNYIAGVGLTLKPVQHRTDKYHIFTKGDFFRDDGVVKRAESTGAPRVGFTLSNDSYDADAWWTSVPLNEMQRANADPAVPLDEAAMRLLTSRMLIRRDRIYAQTFLVENAWATDKVGGTDFAKWSDAASDPEKDIADGKQTVLMNTGLEPNLLIVSYQVHQVLKRHPLIKDRFKFTSSESITPQMLAAFFEVEEYRIAKSVYNTANEGAATAMSFVVGKNALLMYRSGNAGIMEPTAATAFIWSGLTGHNDLGVRVDSFYDVDTKEDVVRGEFAFDMKVTGSDLGYFFSGAVD